LTLKQIIDVVISILLTIICLFALKPIFALYDAGDVLLSYGLGFFLALFLISFMFWQSVKDPLLFFKKLTQCLIEHQDDFRKADSAEMKTISALLNSIPNTENCLVGKLLIKQSDCGLILFGIYTKGLNPPVHSNFCLIDISMTDYNFEKIRMPLLSAIENLSEYKIELTEQLLIAEVENDDPARYN